METSYLVGGLKYEGRVLELLGDCLTSGLVELVEKKPADPVEYLAHYLYNYRKNHPLKNERLTVIKEEVRSVHSDVELLDHSSKQRQFLTDKIQIEIVHKDFQAVFNQMDDFFDDDDFT